MKIDLDAAQRAFANKVSHVFDECCGDPTPGRASNDAAIERPDLWQALATQGILGINVPVSLGGNSSSIRAAALFTHIVMHASGRHLAQAPFLASAVVGTSLAVETAEASLLKLMLPTMLSGRVRLTLAALEAEAPNDCRHVATRASRNEYAWVLEGDKTGVIDSSWANWMIVSARTAGDADDEHGISLFLVSRTARGVEMQSTRGPDGGEVATVTLRGVQVATNDLIGEIDQGYAPLERAVQRGVAALCSEAAGVMEQLLALCNSNAEAQQLVDEALSAALLAADALGNADSAERRRAIANARTTLGNAARSMVSAAAQPAGGAGETTGFTPDDYVRRLNVIAATWAPGG